jgi:AraC family transcriptional regulator
MGLDLTLEREPLTRLVTASNMARWWGREPNGAIEDDRCDLGAAHFLLDGGEPFAATCDPDKNTHILSVHLHGALNNEFSADGVEYFRGSHQQGDVVLIPAGQKPVALLQDSVVAEIMHLYVPDTLVRRCTTELPGRAPTFEIKDHFARNDTEALRAAMIVREEMRSPGFASSLLLDSISSSLAVRIVRQWSNLAEASHPSTQRGGLTPWQVRKVKTIINDRLAEEVRLDELAAEVGLSTFHFARAFKQSTGIPPHRFQTQARLERAREMLARTSMSVLHVALSVGYDSGQAFARAFRREFGCSPAEFHR